MFENLWEEWFDTQLLLAKGTPMARMGYSEIFECLPKEKQKELTDKKLSCKSSRNKIKRNSVRAVMSEILVAALFLLDTMSRSGKEKIANGIYERY